MLLNEVISTSKAEYYSQVHLTPKPVASKGTNDPSASMSVDDYADIADVPTNDTLRETLTSNISSKATQGWRFCIDFRRLNACSNGMGWPIPNIGHMLQRIGDRRPKIFGKFDLTLGYHQAPIAVDYRHFTAFITHAGVYQWN